MKLLRKNQNGFTLVELLIALFIFAVGVLGVATMQITSIKGNSKGRLISEASNVAADRIEMFMSLAYNNSALDDDDGDGVVDGNENGTNQDADGDGIDDDGGNFGLNDLTNPDGAADSDGDGVNDVFWNIAVDHPEPNTKTINVFVFPPGNRTRFVEMSIVKAKVL
jgi:prepilin-type N-terminal cleavage/methylation domain-containing protein